MNLKELIRRFRVLAKDTVKPYLFEDDDVKDWLNDAVDQACVRGRLIRDDSCKIDLYEGEHTYDLPPRLYEIISLRIVNPGIKPRAVFLKSREWLEANCAEWRDSPDPASMAIQDDTTIRVVGQVKVGDVLLLEGYRLPCSPMSGDNDTPEIHLAHHIHLIQWALHKAFGTPDADGFDAGKSAVSEAEFTKYFGPLPDCGLRRETRVDDVQHNHSIIL